MKAINPYLNFNGNAEEAFNFYRSIFGGEFTVIMRMKDVPPEMQMGKAGDNKIMHISLPVGNNNILMGCDVPEQYGESIAGNNFHISINAESEEEADKLFNALSEGGKATMAMNKTFWGAYFGMLVDRFAIQWMVSFDYENR